MPGDSGAGWGPLRDRETGKPQTIARLSAFRNLEVRKEVELTWKGSAVDFYMR